MSDGVHQASLLRDWKAVSSRCGMPTKFSLARGALSLVTLVVSLYLTLSRTSALLASHTRPVRGLQFGPIQHHLLATGGGAGEVCSLMLHSQLLSDCAIGIHLGRDVACWCTLRAYKW